MEGRCGINKAGILSVLTVLLAIALPLAASLVPRPVSGAVAISGSFYTQKFQIPVGGRVSGASIYVVAFNQGTEAATFIVSTFAPAQVTVQPSDTNFILNPSESKRVYLAVEVGADASPGLYTITVGVRAERGEGDGVVVLGSAAQEASLSIVGEAGNVHVETVSPRGDPVITYIRLWKTIEGEQYEFADSRTGVLDATVSPGSYEVKAYSMGVELASEQFEVAHLGQKNISLEVETIYFKYFDVSLARHVRTGELGYAQVLYTIANVYQPVNNASVNLGVKLDGAFLETVTGILTVSTLNLGDTGVPYSYVPSMGWEEGTYSFYLELYIDGQLYATTQEAAVDVELGGARGSWLWIIFVILGVLGALGLGFLIFFLVKRRREEEEKPRKKEKKRKEEKPAPKAKEPVVGKPEPARPPEPVRPVQPARPLPKEEPIVEPSPLASVSSLKARMASLGRDQGTATPDEEEPEAEEPENPVEAAPQDEAFDAVPPPPRAEPEQPAVTQVQKPAGQKPGIYSSVTATPRQEPPKPPDDVQINWPPKPVEPPKSTSFAEAARQRMDAEQPVSPPEEVVPGEETAADEPAEPEAPPSRSSFAEAARLRMEARQRATGGGSGTGEPPAEGDGSRGPGEGQ